MENVEQVEQLGGGKADERNGRDGDEEENENDGGYGEH